MRLKDRNRRFPSPRRLRNRNSSGIISWYSRTQWSC